MIGKSLRLNNRVVRPQSSCASVRFVGQLTSLIAFSALSLAMLPSVQAASINYGNFNGNTVVYQNVTEASGTDPVPLFGAPIVTGDSIDFNPVLFNAFSQFGAPPVDLTNGLLSFMLQAKAGFAMNNISFNEGGLTVVTGIGTDLTYTDVSADGFLNIHEVDHVGINTVTTQIHLTFSHRADGLWELVTDGLARPVVWTGSEFIDLDAVLTAANVPFAFGATKISVVLNNALIAQSESGTTAFIDKKDFGGLTITVNIPEPSTVILAVACFGLLGLIVRRR